MRWVHKPVPKPIPLGITTAKIASLSFHRSWCLLGRWQVCTWCLFCNWFRQYNLIARPHRFKHLALCLGALLFYPFGLDILLYLLELRHPAGGNRVNQDRVPAVPRLDWALPRTGFQLEHRLGKVWTELFS